MKSKFTVKDKSEDKILHLLLSGKHPDAKKYAGHHVLLIGKEILPLKEDKKTLKDIERLEKKYGKTPVAIFVPRLDVSYILVCKN